MSHGRILIVDDEPDICTIVAELLGFADYETVEAHTPQEALELIKSQVFDVVVTDLMMPAMSGDCMIEEARKLPTTQHTRFVIMSGGAEADLSPEMLEKLRRLSHGYLRKPTDEDEILTMIRSVMKKNS